MKRAIWNLENPAEKTRFTRHLKRLRAENYGIACDTCLKPCEVTIDRQDKQLHVGATIFSRVLSNSLEAELKRSDFPFQLVHANGHVTWGDTNIPFLSVRLDLSDDDRRDYLRSTGESCDEGPYLLKGFVSYFMEREVVRRIENVTTLKIGDMEFFPLATIKDALPGFRDQFAQIERDWRAFDNRGKRDTP